MNTLRKLMNDSRGLSTLEYAILFVLIVSATVGLWNSVGKELTQQLKTSATTFSNNIKPAQ